MNSVLVFVVNLAATWYMVGLIWMVQMVHYYLFNKVGADGFAAYAEDHNRLITPIVGLPMLLELVTAATLCFAAPSGFPRWAAAVGLIMLAAIWLSTATIQIPYHGQLIGGFNESAYQGLVRTNWIRTVLWSARGLLMSYFAWQLMQRSIAT